MFHHFNLLVKIFSLFSFILVVEQTQLPSCHDRYVLSIHNF